MPIQFRIAMILACLQAGSFIVVALAAAVPIPIIDNLEITGSYLRDGFSWDWLTGLVNQHSIIVPRLLLLADLELTGGHMTSFVGMALLAWCVVFILLWRCSVVAARDRIAGAIAAVLLALMMFRGFLLESIVLNNGFNYPLTALFAVLAAMAAASLMPGRPVLTGASLSAMSALAAGLCLINGGLAIPLAALIAWFRSRSVLVFIPFILAALAMIFLYRIDGELPTGQFNVDYGVVLHSLLNLFGAPWVQKVGAAGRVMGLLVLSVAAISVWLVFRRGKACTVVEAIAGMLILFGGGSALMVAIGRPEISEVIGSAGRYGLWVALVHAGIILALIQSPIAVSWTRNRYVGSLLLIAFLLLMIEQGRYAIFYSRIGGDMQIAAAALRAGERSPALFEKMRSRQDAAGTAYDLYAAHGLYGFSRHSH